MASLDFDIVAVTPLQQNCVILFNEALQIGTVIDPGGDIPCILHAINKNVVQIDRIVLTHGHLDHAGGATELAAMLGVEIVGPHISDEFLLNSIVDHGHALGISGMRNCTPDRFLSEGESIELAGVSFEVLHCPGHTPGHVVFIDRLANFAILGDVMFRGSVGRTDFPYSDHRALMMSIGSKIMKLNDDMSFLCGHGPSSTIGYERINNPFMREALSFGKI